MAVFTYTDWASQATTAAQLARLNLHIGEVAAELAANTSKDGASRTVDPLVAYNRDLLAQRTQLMQMPDVSAGGGANITRVRFGSGLPS